MRGWACGSGKSGQSNKVGRGDFLTPDRAIVMCSNIQMENVSEIPPNEAGRPLPMPDGRPVPCFFGRRFLTFHDLVEIGLVSNAMTLRRLIAEGRFPPPLEMGRRIRLWDAIELEEFVARLAAERNKKAAV